MTGDHCVIVRVLWCLRRARRAQEWCLGCLLRCYALGSALSLGCPRACVPCRVVLGRPPLPLGCPRACVPCPLAVLRARPIFEGLAVLAEAASCGDRLRHTLFCQESAGAGTAAEICGRGLAPRPRPFDATHRRVRRHGCPEARPLGFGLSVRVFRIAKLEGSYARSA